MFDKLIEEEEEVVVEEKDNTFNYDNWLLQKVQEYKNNKTIDQTETNLRYRDASNIRWSEDSEVLVIGLGTIGGIALPVLSNMSFKNITAVDPDTIEIHNVHNQDYDVVDIGLPKVEAMRRKILRHSGVNIRTEEKEIKDISDIEAMFGGKFPNIVYIGVDNMEFRNTFWRYIAHSVRYEEFKTLPELVIDARMTLGTFNVLALPLRALGRRRGKEAIDKIYANYCFEDEEALQERCTARSIIFCATAIASYTAALINWYGNNRREGDWAAFMDVNSPQTDFKWIHSFNVMDWRMISKTPHETRLQNKIQELQKELAESKRDIIVPEDPNPDPDRELLITIGDKEIYTNTLLVFSEEPECPYTLELDYRRVVYLHPQDPSLNDIILSARVFRSMFLEGDINVSD